MFLSASGATNQASLLFFKRFTKDEENKYAEIRAKVRKEIEAKYSDEIAEAKELHAENKRELAKALKEISKRIEKEFETVGKDKIKELFDYEPNLWRSKKPA